jgi:hypothetical protein
VQPLRSLQDSFRQVSPIAEVKIDVPGRQVVESELAVITGRGAEICTADDHSHLRDRFAGTGINDTTAQICCRRDLRNCCVQRWDCDDTARERCAAGLWLFLHGFKIRLDCDGTSTIHQFDHVSWIRFEFEERHDPSSLTKVFAAIYANGVAKSKSYRESVLSPAAFNFLLSH